MRWVREVHTELDFTCDPPVARLRLAGEFDLSTDDQVKDLFDSVAACGCHDLELDLSAVSFMDLGTLYLLDAHRRRVTARGGSFVVVAESSCYRRVRELGRYVVLTVDGQADDAPGDGGRPRGRLHFVGRRPPGRPSPRPHRA
jgi:anti-anti-sigma factor